MAHMFHYDSDIDGNILVHTPAEKPKSSISRHEIGVDGRV